MLIRGRTISSPHHAHPPVVPANEFITDFVEWHNRPKPNLNKAIIAFGLLTFLGLLGIVIKLFTVGLENRSDWGYLAAITAFLLSTAGCTPFVVLGLRMIKAHWRRPIARIAESYSLVTVVTFSLIILLLFLIPSSQNRRTIWFQNDHVGTVGAIPFTPHLYVIIGVLCMVLAGLGLWWTSLRPDIRLVNNLTKSDKPTNKSWVGNLKQWRVQNKGLAFLGAFFFMTFIWAITLYCIDLCMSLVPGWRDAIFPVYQTLSGIQGGLATVILSMYVLRRFGGFEKYIFMEHFWAASKPLLATCLLWFYFWFCAFIIFWYGRMPIEQDLLQLIMFGPYNIAFYIGFSCCFLFPFLILVWNTVRKTVWGPPVASTLIIIGCFFDKVRLYVSSYSVQDDLALHAITEIPATILPNLTDILIIIGGFSLPIFIMLLCTRLFPIMSVWEMTEGLRLTKLTKYLRTELRVLGKPE